MSNLKKKFAVVVLAATAGVGSLMIVPASPASAMPKQEFKFLCGAGGGVYRSMGRGSCTWGDTTIINNPNEP